MKENPQSFAAIKNLIEQYYERGVDFLYEDTPISKKRAYHLFSSAMTLFQALEIKEKEELNEVYNKLRSRLKKLGDIFVNPDGSERNPRFVVPAKNKYTISVIRQNRASEWLADKEYSNKKDAINMAEFMWESGKYLFIEVFVELADGSLDTVWERGDRRADIHIVQDKDVVKWAKEQLRKDKEEFDAEQEKKARGEKSDYDIIEGNPLGVRGGATIEQAVLFNMDLWTKSTARKWLKEHKKKYGKILKPETGHFWHAVQIPSTKLKKDITGYRIYQPPGFPEGVKQRLGIRKGAPRRNPEELNIICEDDNYMIVDKFDYYGSIKEPKPWGDASYVVVDKLDGKVLRQFSNRAEMEEAVQDMETGKGIPYRNIYRKNPRRIPKAPREISNEAEELHLYIKNDRDIYRQRHLPIIENLKRKIKRGIFDKEKAVKLFYYMVHDVAKKYCKEFNCDERQMFPVETKNAVAYMLRDDFVNEYEAGEYKINPFRINPLTIEEASELEYKINPGLLVVNPLTPATAMLVNPVKPGSYLIDDPKSIFGIYVANIYDSAGYVDDGVGATRREAMKNARAKVTQLMS